VLLSFSPQPTFSLFLPLRLSLSLSFSLSLSISLSLSLQFSLHFPLSHTLFFCPPPAPSLSLDDNVSRQVIDLNTREFLPYNGYDYTTR